MAQNKWEKLFEEFLDLTEFSLIKHKNPEHIVEYETPNGEPDCAVEYYGIWSIYDRQGANLGDINSDRFDNAGQILERMDIYIHDYIVEDIENCLDEKGLLPEYEYDGYDDILINAAPLLPENKWEFDVLDMIVNHFDEINLENVYYEEEE